MDKTSLGTRMKQYEHTTQITLLRRTPVIIRVDGRAFHTFVPRHFNTDTDPSLTQSPFSVPLHAVMSMTAYHLTNQIQNAVFAYTQSDEISILLHDWNNHETQQWFGGNVQKIVSLSSSIATAAFNFYMRQSAGISIDYVPHLAHFDARVFNLPKEEVVNYFIWRQQDATRNSVQQLARFYYSHKELQGKNNVEIMDMLMIGKGVNWNDLDVWKRRGSCVYQNPKWSPVLSSPRLVDDQEPPIFTQDREYIEQHLIARPQNEIPQGEE